MRQIRNWIPILGILALAVLFFKLPEAPKVFDLLGCKSCFPASDPYLPLMGAGYFAVLVAVSLLFPSFPSPVVARGGLTWAVLLAVTLTYLGLPRWCAACLIAHACHILIWVIWVIAPSARLEAPPSPLRERLCLTLFAPVSVVALFSCLNLTFMAYGFKITPPVSATTLHPGEAAPAFAVQTAQGRTVTNADAARGAGLVINFISPDCPYCKEQLPVLDAVASQLAAGPYRFINVSPALPPDLVQRSPATEWVKDSDGKLRKLFGVGGYPTMFVVNADGKIVQVIPGVPEQLKARLLASLAGSQQDTAQVR